MIGVFIFGDKSEAYASDALFFRNLLGCLAGGLFDFQALSVLSVFCK